MMELTVVTGTRSTRGVLEEGCSIDYMFSGLL